METILYNISSIHNIQQYNLKIKPKEECSSGKVPLEVSKYPCSDIQLYTWNIYLQWEVSSACGLTLKKK